MADDNSSWVALHSAELAVQIDPAGAQLSVLRDHAGRDLLWHGDPTVWAGRAPVLFPIVGTLAGGSYRLGSKRYALSRHGFARGKVFETVSANASSALFRLSADDATRAVYPFNFVLEMSYALQGPTLSITAAIRNAGSEDMPASIGFHPGFRWPLPFGQPRAAHFLEFEQDEPAPVRRINSDGLLAPEPHPTPIANQRLSLTDDLFRNDVLILDAIKSHSLRYGAPSGPQLEIEFPNAHYLGLWTKPGAEFICIEPWQGVTDPAGFTGDLHAKPGVFSVAPRATHSMSMTITLHA